MTQEDKNKIDKKIVEAFFARDTRVMSDDEVDFYLEVVLRLMEITRQELYDQVEIGVNNGYSIEKQFDIYKMHYS